MRFGPEILDEIRARVPVSAVVARKVALKRAGREMKGLSPFKAERTPSFFVNDQKGFYHCFASGEHGDIFTFLMKTEGLSFTEAVERLAAEAGVNLPKPDAKSAAREDQRTRLLAVVETSAKFYQQSLYRAVGAEALAYLTRRGVGRATLERFRLGFAPAGRRVLRDYLAAQGFSLAEMVTSGMLIGGDDIAEPYDRFRNRVMFPISDLRGQAIAFGGRALEKDVPAKYLNSPETPLFHKGHNLYNAHRARQPAHDRGRIVVVEGYMDVVALAEAGIEEAVAPLGTALTEEQMRLIWRLVPEPVLCFDGDSAGQRAAHRAIDTVLPHLVPGKSVSFAFLPDGLDPDDLVRQQGAAAMQAVLARARPLIEVLIERELARNDAATPERRAAIERDVRVLIARIEDATVRAHYQQAVLERLAALWGGRGHGRRQGENTQLSRSGLDGSRRRHGQGFRPQPGHGQPLRRGASFEEPRPRASESLKRSALVAGQEAGRPSLREALILKCVLNHPWLLEEEAERLAELPFAQPALDRLRTALLSLQAGDTPLDRQSVAAQLAALDLTKVVELVERAVTHNCDRFAAIGTARNEVEMGWRHSLALHERLVGLRWALAAEERHWHDSGSEDALARIREIKQQMAALEAAEAQSSDVVL